ncbi:terminase [Xenophilus sp. AP218F]|nr:terminase [Xenophilus sp. AP218F]
MSEKSTFPPDALATLGERLKDPLWRLENLYWIMDADGNEVQFRPNRAQRRFMRRFWHRNIILKARQLGFTTFIQIFILDSMLFTPNIRCGVIAHKKEDAENFFSDKLLFAYDHLPAVIRHALPAVKRSGGTLRLVNNSQVRVAVSLRSGTLQILHVSEFGKLCKEFPGRAREVITGTLPTVQADGMVFIESTAEGAEGEFYRMTTEGLKLQQMGKTLKKQQYKVHFFAWWQDPKYVADPAGMELSEDRLKYWNELESKIGRAISPEQRAWYELKLQELGDIQKMWQEFPSTPEEAFKVSTEGCYYAAQMAQVRRDGRIRKVPWVPGVVVNTFWDLGASDNTAIWFHQQVGMEHRFIRYYEESGEDLSHYMKYLQDTGYVFGSHYLPHDAEQERLSADGNKSIRVQLEELGMRNIEVVPRVDNIQAGISSVRTVLPHCYFDEAGCADGIRHLDYYRKDWNATLGVWKSQPRHDEHSHGSDAFRQFAQRFDEVLRLQMPKRTRRPANHRTA